ncbi:WXG100 family type VII secretion target [Streptomyces smyrnaeus]|uniref:WXG100 family type VII secretion target n=1 Tax=Streptomyces TaxID=1883 RepID=UPI000C17A395|nr:MULTISPECIES: WXG100 family type VII secretion target [unclassified Streptomyces]MBQ0868389.1 WXG100 family type VII secretion target [Streptomyces sp. RK75]MBQ1123514.1 WXG100 family type VII secretion target [Streptomyces sp. B15]MBQ1158868.1 WXG100 family type VII secretion target [Streptomyces sp. A73]
MADQKLSDDQLDSKQKALIEKIGNINSQVRGLQGVIDAIEGQWQGIGAHAFDVKQNEINNRMKEINNLLAYFLEGIQATRKKSGANELDIAQALKGVDVVDGGGLGTDASGQSVSKLDMYSPPPAR